jgi:2-polyprenyl-3-methyl-5-hydroxy-6-metoxy-1,4-benzoquinol methylase
MDNQSTETQATVLKFTTAASLYDSLGKAYQDAFKDIPGQLKSLEWLLSHLPAEGGANILDVGCGTGRPTAEILSAANHKVTGIDISPTMVDIASQQVPSATFEVADARLYDPSPAGTQYDAVTCYYALLACFTQPQVRDVLARISSWIRPGGYFVYSTLPVHLDSVWLEWMGRKTLVTSFTKEGHLDMLKDNGFEILHWEEVKFQPHAESFEEEHLFIYARK